MRARKRPALASGRFADLRSCRSAYCLLPSIQPYGKGQSVAKWAIKAGVSGRVTQRADCMFCRIVRREIQTYIVLEDLVSRAFLDHRPLFPGHCLLLPKDHYETLLDLPASLLVPLFSNAQFLARAMEEGLGAEGTFVAINNRISQSVPHFHIHIVPRRRKDGLRGFFWPRQKYKDEAAMVEVQNALRSAIARLLSRR